MPALPGWTGDRKSESLEDSAFFSGAALAVLDRFLADPGGGPPLELLGNRLALRAAENCLNLEGRRDSQAEIRDAFYLTRPGDAPGLAGEMLIRWRRLSATRLRHRDWHARLSRCLPEEMHEPLAQAVKAPPGRGAAPVARAAGLLAALRRAFPDQEGAALIGADLVLARALGWARPLPLLGLCLTRRDLGARGEAQLRACHRAVARAARDTICLGADLRRRAAYLRAQAVHLRARGAGAAVALFLVEDAVLPSTMLAGRRRGGGARMSDRMSDRAARRLCQRLVALGAVRELTGRSTFRLYGVG